MEIYTTQNVYITQEKAGIGERFLAVLIDLVILTGFSILTLFLTSKTELFVFVSIFNGILFFLYPLIFEYTMNGQTLGKLFLKIRVVDISGENAGFYQYLIRNLLRVVDYIFGLGLVFMIFSEKDQRIGDLAAGTYVVKIKNEMEYSNTAFAEVNETHVPVLQRFQAEKLTAQHIEIIKEVLADSEKNMRFEAVGQLYEKVCQIIDHEQKELTHIDFLDGVVKDFNYYNL